MHLLQVGEAHGEEHCGIGVAHDVGVLAVRGDHRVGHAVDGERLVADDSHIRQSHLRDSVGLGVVAILPVSRDHGRNGHVLQRRPPRHGEVCKAHFDDRVVFGAEVRVRAVRRHGRRMDKQRVQTRFELPRYDEVGQADLGDRAGIAAEVGERAIRRDRRRIHRGHVECCLIELPHVGSCHLRNLDVAAGWLIHDVADAAVRGKHTRTITRADRVREACSLHESGDGDLTHGHRAGRIGVRLVVDRIADRCHHRRGLAAGKGDGGGRENQRDE